MNDTITSAFAPAIGLPCWGVDRVHGSILTFEFGTPRLIVREPHVSTSSSPKVRSLMARRMVKPVGEWHLLIYMCRWRILLAAETLADDGCEQAQIETAARELNGQKLVALTLDAPSRTTTFAFDLGGCLTTWPYEAYEDGDEHWSLYLPDGYVLSYQTNGCYSFEPGDAKLGEEVWHPVMRSVLIP